MRTRENSAVISLACGVLSAMFYWLIPILPSVAVACGCIALKKIKVNGLKGRGMAIWGIVLGLLYCFQILLKVFLNGGSVIL